MRLRFWCLAIGSLALSRPVLACPDYASESHVTRYQPVATIPAGAVQLRVTVAGDEEEMRSLRGEGTVTLAVEEVVDGPFADQTVTITFRNDSSCDYFGPTGRSLYVVLFPMRYAEGDLFLDDQGRPEFELIRYNWNEDPDYTGVAATAYFNEWFQPELVAKRYSCWRRGGKSQEAIEACVESDAPDELYQGMGRSAAALVVGGLAALGFGALVWRKAAG